MKSFCYSFFWRRIGMIKPPVQLGVGKISYRKRKNLLKLVR